ncbi:TolC family protein, partial [Escherichia coli]|nr:TolC family protein [Escherichia coli]
NFPQRDRSLTFGVAIGIPLFNKNQGEKTQAEISIKQAQARREFTERIVRSEILSAYQRFEAASRAVLTLETSAIPRS